jgi:hypothetical protein
MVAVNVKGGEAVMVGVKGKVLVADGILDAAVAEGDSSIVGRAGTPQADASPIRINEITANFRFITILYNWKYKPDSL